MVSFDAELLQVDIGSIDIGVRNPVVADLRRGMGIQYLRLKKKMPCSPDAIQQWYRALVLHCSRWLDGASMKHYVLPRERPVTTSSKLVSEDNAAEAVSSHRLVQVNGGELPSPVLQVQLSLGDPGIEVTLFAIEQPGGIVRFARELVEAGLVDEPAGGIALGASP